MTVLNWLLFLLSISIAFLTGAWMLDRKPPVEFISAVVATPAINPGGTVRIEYVVDRIRNCHVTIEHVLFDSGRGRYAVGDEDYIVDPGPLGADEYAVVITVPTNFPAGVARYRSARSYYCNPLQRFFDWPIIVPPFREQVRDLHFQVVGPSPATATPTPLKIE